MTDLGAPDAPERHGAPTNELEGDVSVKVLAVAVALVLILAAAVGYVLTRPDKADAEPSYPANWDARIAPYVKTTEKLRGLMFLHPVEVEFLSGAEFKKTLEADEADLTDEDREQMEDMTGVLRAVGLLKGNPDLFKAGNDFATNGTLAYYSFEDQRITIRGQKVTASVRPTVVHELTHALQDQHFSVGDRLEELNKESDEPQTTESDVLRAVIEGDARRVQTLYRDSLSAKQRKALDASSTKEYDKAEPGLKDVPQIIITMLTSSYTLGQALVQTAATDGDNSGVDDLFGDTPEHDLALLDPFTVLEDRSEPAAIDVPELKEGEQELASGDFGVTLWYFMLAERLPLRAALAAADGWGGDGFLAYEAADGSDCARATLTGAGKQDTERLYVALRKWIVAAPGTPAEVTRAGSRIRFQSCDPGKAAKVGKDVSEKAVALTLERTYTAIALMKGGGDADLSRCLAGKLIEAFPLSVLQDPTYADNHPEFVPRVQALSDDCRAELD